MSDCGFYDSMRQREHEEMLANLPAKRQAIQAAMGVIPPPPPIVYAPDDPIELAYWEFDSRRKGDGRWKGMPQSERDAFKAVVRGLLAEAEAAKAAT